MDGGEILFENLDLNDSPMDIDPSPAPRPRRFQPKLKGKSKLPPPPPPTPAPPQETEQSVADVSSSAPQEMEQSVPVADVASIEENDGAEDEEEDTVVREIDVFCSPLEGDAQLYVMQYPLRPFWRPYELEERCEEVLFNSQCSEVELVLSVDVHSVNYDKDVSAPMSNEKQILKSSRSISAVDLVAGTLLENQLYLNPVHEVLQFRPSLDHLNDDREQKGKQKVQEVDHLNDDMERKGKQKVQEVDHLNDDRVQKGKQKVQEVGNNFEKPMIPLQFHETNSTFSQSYKQKTLERRDYCIDFTMNRYEYVNSLCPAPSTVKRTTQVSPSSFKPSLPLEERLKEYLCTVSQINRFDALTHLDSSTPEEELLKMLDRHALLVQGLWVPKSSLLFEGHTAHVRDYILLLFSQNHAVKKRKLNRLARPDQDHLRKLLRPLAYERPIMMDWKLKEERDTSFIKRYVQIVKDQEDAWSERGKDLEKSLFRGRTAQPLSSSNRPPTNMAKRKLDADKVDITSDKIESGGRESLPAASMSTDIRQILHKAVREIFKDRNARSMNTILRGLSQLAASLSARAKEDSKNKAIASAINHAASNRTPELLSVLKEVVFRVHNVYVFRSGSDPALNPLREVVVRLFSGKKPNAELKKQEIVEAVKTTINRDISNIEYDQVVKDLCVHSKEGLALRTVDKLE